MLHQIVKRDHLNVGMAGQIFGGVVEKIDERLIGVAVAEVFPPMGDEHGYTLGVYIVKNAVQHGVASPVIGEQTSRMGQQQRLADAPMRRVAQLLKKKTGPPSPRQPPKLIPAAGKDAKTPGNFSQAVA